jgi:hypothetical protein
MGKYLLINEEGSRKLTASTTSNIQGPFNLQDGFFANSLFKHASMISMENYFFVK